MLLTLCRKSVVNVPNCTPTNQFMTFRHFRSSELRSWSDRLMEQISPFDPVFHLGQTVVELEKKADGRFRLLTSENTEFDTATVILAAGLGAFQPRRLKTAGEWEEKTIHYKLRNPEKLTGKDIIILGGGDSALDWALELHDKVNSLTLIHRRPDYRAAPASVSAMKELAASGAIKEFVGQVQSVLEDNGEFSGLEVKGPGRHRRNSRRRGLCLLRIVAQPRADCRLGN